MLTNPPTLPAPQVVNTVSTKEIEKQAVYCRCWKSGTFPLCNGAHNAHNKETGDNVGMCVVGGYIDGRDVRCTCGAHVLCHAFYIIVRHVHPHQRTGPLIIKKEE